MWLQAARHRLGKQQVSEEEARRKALIEQFTDAATTLMSGEADIFEQHREELQHALQMQEVLAPRPEQGMLQLYTLDAVCTSTKS
jgi:hypothetical protein